MRDLLVVLVSFWPLTIMNEFSEIRLSAFRAGSLLVSFWNGSLIFHGCCVGNRSLRASHPYVASLILVRAREFSSIFWRKVIDGRQCFPLMVSATDVILHSFKKHHHKLYRRCSTRRLRIWRPRMRCWPSSLKHTRFFFSFFILITMNELNTTLHVFCIIFHSPFVDDVSRNRA